VTVGSFLTRAFRETMTSWGSTRVSEVRTDRGAKQNFGRLVAAATAAVAVLVLLALLLLNRPDATLIVANRSDATLAVGPGVVIAPCSSASLTFSQFEDARVEGQTGWNPPDGAVLWTNEAFQSNGWSGTMTVIVSSTAASDVRVGRVDENDLPVCGGQPIVNELVILPD
jgi:hypothetical protein